MQQQQQQIAQINAFHANVDFVFVYSSSKFIENILSAPSVLCVCYCVPVVSLCSHDLQRTHKHTMPIYLSIRTRCVYVLIRFVSFLFMSMTFEQNCINKTCKSRAFTIQSERITYIRAQRRIFRQYAKAKRRIPALRAGASE